MIIPPDPEKDPRLFSESRTSLVTDADLISLDEPAHPEAAFHRDRDFLYSSPFSDDYATYHNEALPPYDPQRAPVSGQPRPRRSARNSELLVRVTSASSSQSSLGSTSSHSTARGATLNGSSVPIVSSSLSPTTTVVGSGSGSRGKVWEGVDGSPSTKKNRFHIPPRARTYWQTHRRWLTIVIVLVVALILVAAGLAAGLVMAKEKRHLKEKPWKDKEWPGSPNASVKIGTLNITYVSPRDDPKKADGEPCLCNQLAPLNMSSSLSQLALTSDFFDHYITSYEFKLSNDSYNQTSLLNPLYFIAHGLAASGTVEFVGSDSPEAIKEGAKEGVITVDVLARSPKDRPLNTLAKICKLRRADGSEGVGIFTPIESDQGGAGSVTSYLLDPLQTPAFHVIVRLPPSAMLGNPNNTVVLPDVSLTLAGMGVRLGQLKDIARFGSLKMMADCRGGGIVVNYVAADDVLISGAEGTVQGTFNVSSSLNINSTSGAIFSNVILHNPLEVNDQSPTIDSTIPMPKTRKRGYTPPPHYSAVVVDDAAMDEGDGNETHYPTHTTHESTHGWPTPTPSAPDHDGDSDDSSDSYTATNTATNWHDNSSTTPDNSTGNATWTGNGTMTNMTNVTELTPAQRAAAKAKEMYSWVPVRNHTISNNFVTNEGFIFVAYLHHPPTVALQSFVASQSGMVDVSMHPSYVGPFALVNLWGSIRMPPVTWPVSGDPAPWLNRNRKIIQGAIDVSNSTFFGDQRNKFSKTSESAASSVTGTAAWSSEVYPVTNALSCQYSKEGNNSGLYALANLGDLQVTFDGT